MQANKQITLLALLSTVHAAGSALRDTATGADNNWPVYTDWVKEPTAVTSLVAKGYSGVAGPPAVEYGDYSCIRRGYNRYWPQTLDGTSLDVV